MQTQQNKRRTGSRMEELAAAFLAEHGVRILHRNYRVRQAEIDLVCMDGDTLVFVEVKARRSGTSGMASEAVTDAKQKKICRCADHYMAEHQIDPYSCPIRFDVVTIGAEEESRERDLRSRTLRDQGSARPAQDGGPPHHLFPPVRMQGMSEGDACIRDPARHIQWIRSAFPYRRGKPSKPHWRVY